MKYLLIYLLIINAAGFVVMLVDKLYAKRNMWRISEATLLSVALAGGSLGCLAGMYTVRHKTRHKKFTIGIPAILVLQLLLALWLLLYRTR